MTLHPTRAEQQVAEQVADVTAWVVGFAFGCIVGGAAAFIAGVGVGRYVAP